MKARRALLTLRPASEVGRSCRRLASRVACVRSRCARTDRGRAEIGMSKFECWASAVRFYGAGARCPSFVYPTPSLLLYFSTLRARPSVTTPRCELATRSHRNSKSTSPLRSSSNCSWSVVRRASCPRALRPKHRPLRQRDRVAPWTRSRQRGPVRAFSAEHGLRILR